MGIVANIVKNIGKKSENVNESLGVIVKSLRGTVHFTEMEDENAKNDRGIEVL